MELFVNKIISRATSSSEIIDPKTFLKTTKLLTDVIIELFEFFSSDLLHSFLTLLFKSLQTEVSSSNKMRKYSAAKVLVSIITIFPFDELITQYRSIIDTLLSPNYMIIVSIAGKVLSRVAKINGPIRNSFLLSLLKSSSKNLHHSHAPERNVSTIIWYELSSQAPELIYSFKENLFIIFQTSFFSFINRNSSMMVDIFQNLFDSDSSCIALDFLLNFRMSMISFSFAKLDEFLLPDHYSIFLQVLLILFRILPPIPFNSYHDRLFHIVTRFLRDNNTPENILLAIQLSPYTNRFDNLFQTTFQLLFQTTISQPVEYLPILESYFSQMTGLFERESDFILGKINFFFKKNNENIFYFLIHLVSNAPHTFNLIPYLQLILSISSLFPLIPIDLFLASLSKSNPTWEKQYRTFRNQILEIIRKGLTSSTPLIALSSLLYITFTDSILAQEFSSLIFHLTFSKDREVRLLIPSSIFHLFNKFPNQIPIDSVLSLLYFLLDEPDQYVRVKALKSFNVFSILSQPEVFSVLCNFLYDESYEVRKKICTIFRKLSIYNPAPIRTYLILAMKQIPKFTKENLEILLSFPSIITVGKVIQIYSQSLFEKFSNFFQERININLQNKTQIFLDSALNRKTDECLIKCISRLYIVSPKSIPIDSFLFQFLSLLSKPIHPATKIIILKSLKNLVEFDNSLITNTKIYQTLYSLLKKKESLKIIAKATKVIGFMGKFSAPEKKNLNFIFTLI